MYIFSKIIKVFLSLIYLFSMKNYMANNIKSWITYIHLISGVIAVRLSRDTHVAPVVCRYANSCTWCMLERFRLLETEKNCTGLVDLLKLFDFMQVYVFYKGSVFIMLIIYFCKMILLYLHH